MTSSQFLIVTLLFLVILSFISICAYIYFIRSKKVMRGNVMLDNFSRESIFQSLLKRYSITIVSILASLVLTSIAIYFL